MMSTCPVLDMLRSCCSNIHLTPLAIHMSRHEMLLQEKAVLLTDLNRISAQSVGTLEEMRHFDFPAGGRSSPTVQH